MGQSRTRPPVGAVWRGWGCHHGVPKQGPAGHGEMGGGWGWGQEWDRDMAGVGTGTGWEQGQDGDREGTGTWLPRGQGQDGDREMAAMGTGRGHGRRYSHVRQRGRAAQRGRAHHGLLSFLPRQQGRGDLGHQRDPGEGGQGMRTLGRARRGPGTHRGDTHGFAFGTGVTFVAWSAGLALRGREGRKD